MSTKMLIDAAHPEETRVVVVRDGKVEEFDFEAASRKQLRGNIYLAKVTRVEPSLQAAFVDYGGNRHGFLAFSEIHPDYYQIPYADRQALIAEEAAEDAPDSDDAEEVEGQAAPESDFQDNGDDHGAEESSGTVEVVASGADDNVESVGGDDALEELPVRRTRPRRSYKIQEVIKKRQVLLVQVVKEERGTKGAALTTYLSLAGRFSVLMPNTARGGGISRKITNPADRKRLKAVAAGLDVPEGMGVILRTAGAARTKAEIKRDFEYLLRLWENVRELTLESVAPTLVYEEGSLVKRAIRDLYTKDITEVLVNGDAAYREAKDFMRMLMPSHARNVQPYRAEEPIFFKHNIEAQLDAMFSPKVTLKSGGYIVLSQTEALVAIDVNSGRSTREHNIEDTALKTNLEAADEIARQLRLRDLAGLIVIDFIDMEEKRNNRAVERRLKEALKHDRARIQVGRISHFGLLEMSRQRIRFGVLESSLQPCPQCEGTGTVRSVESVALHVLRSIEYELRRGRPTDLVVRVRTPVALYILNQKRDHLRELEGLGVMLRIEADESLNGTMFGIEKGEPARPVERDITVRPVSVDPDESYEETQGAPVTEAASPVHAEPEEDDQHRRKSRRRRRKRGGEAAEGKREEAAAVEQADVGESEGAEEGEAGAREEADGESEAAARRRRRGRRGGRRHRRDQSSEAESQAGSPEEGRLAQPASGEVTAAETVAEEVDQPPPEEAAAPWAEEPLPEAPTERAAEPAPEALAGSEEAKPKRRPRRRKTEAKETPEESVEPAADGTKGDVASERDAPTFASEAAPGGQSPQEATEPARAYDDESERANEEAGEATVPRRGWWQRRKLFGG